MKHGKHFPFRIVLSLLVKVIDHIIMYSYKEIKRILLKVFSPFLTVPMEMVAFTSSRS